MCEAYSTHGRDEIHAKILVGKPEGKRPLERPTCSWEGNVRMHLTEIGREVVDGIHLAQELVIGGHL